MKLYVDMDGVLVNFNGGVKKIFKSDKKCSEIINDYGIKEFWQEINKINDFWENLEPLHDDIEQIWKSLQNKIPHIAILSSPSRHPNCIPGKSKWLDKHIGQNHLRLFTPEKHKYACPNSILIDDMEKNITNWESAGGVGILFEGKFDDNFWKIFNKKIEDIKMIYKFKINESN